MEIKPYIQFTLLLLTGLIVFSGCEKFEGDQTIPSYIQIDTVILTENTQLIDGRLTHNFTDVWVYVDDQVIGAFELPATIPVLVEGKHELSVFAGVKLNAMSGTRSQYSFTGPHIIDDFKFTIDSVTRFQPTVSYYDNTDFAWIEEFDFTNPESIALIPSSNSDTTHTEINREDTDPLYARLGSRSGIGYVDSENTVFEITTKIEPENGFYFPAGASPVILELEFNTNIHLVVGLFIREDNINQHPVLVLKPTDGEWKKVYVNFTPAISSNATAENFNVFFRADWDGAADPGVIMLDNIKLLRK